MKKSRTFCTPCEYLGLVYIGGLESSNVVVFDPFLETFTETKLIFTFSSQTVAFVKNSELVIISTEDVIFWNDKTRSATNVMHKPMVLNSNMPPIVRGNQVYIAYKGVCSEIDTENWTSRELVS